MKKKLREEKTNKMKKLTLLFLILISSLTLTAQTPILNAQVDGTIVTLSWDMVINAKWYDTYQLERKTDSTDWVCVSCDDFNIKGSGMSYQDKELTPFTTYYYRIKLSYYMVQYTEWSEVIRVDVLDIIPSVDIITRIKEGNYDTVMIYDLKGSLFGNRSLSDLPRGIYIIILDNRRVKIWKN